MFFWSVCRCETGTAYMEHALKGLKLNTGFGGEEGGGVLPCPKFKLPQIGFFVCVFFLLLLRGTLICEISRGPPSLSRCHQTVYPGFCKQQKLYVYGS